MAIQKFNVEKYQEHHRYFSEFIEYPEKFSAKIEGTETMNELVMQTAEHIKNSEPKWNLGRTTYSAFIDYCDNVEIPEGNIAVDETNNIAGFVLLNDDCSVKEGLYGIKKDGTILKGKLLKYNYFECREPSSRHLISGLEEGILKGEVVKKEDKKDFSYNLKDLL